ncbi:MAG: hypothetical protein IT164_05750 [Bryobacterales bacterium]|nr:hypothetical protein [Bryobacterales bacterium]
MTTRAERVAKLQANVATLTAEMEALKNPTAGEIVDEAVQIYMRDNGEKSYAVALEAILAANPDLAKEYRESFSF